MSGDERPCIGCGEPTLNVAPDVCRDCEIERYHREMDAKTCPTCKHIRYANLPSDPKIIGDLRSYFWGEPCACPAVQP